VGHAARAPIRVATPGLPPLRCPIGTSSPSSLRPPQFSGFSTTSASPPSHRGSARHAGRPRGTTRPPRPYPTGTPWPNHNPSTSSAKRCSGSPPDSNRCAVGFCVPYPHLSLTFHELIDRFCGLKNSSRKKFAFPQGWSKRQR
jgi:hypothetical protein